MEFALILPIFLTLIMGIVELGRLMFVYNSVATASREAARYGAWVGVNASGVEHYRDCSGIRDTAQRLAGITPIEHTDISIVYNNPATGFHETSCPPSQFELGDRIIVVVTINFEPIVPLVDLSNTHDIKVTGGSNSTFTGTIYAPNTDIELAGSGITLGLVSTQIIGNSVKVTGSADINITYDESQVFNLPSAIDLIK